MVFGCRFTIATQSLNAVYGTMRAGDYDSNVDPRVSYVTSYLPNGTTRDVAHGSAIGKWYYGAIPAKRLYNDQYTSYYYRYNSFDTIQPQNNQLTQRYEDYSEPANGQVGLQYSQFATSSQNTVGLAKYQFTIDSKQYPQYLADVADCYALTKNSFDGNGGNRDFVGLMSSLKSWAGNCFALGISLDHNGEDNLRDRLVSGLNTNGSNIPITFTMNGVTLPPLQVRDGTDALVASTAWTTSTVRPIVFCELTSTVLLYPGRVISVIN